MSAARAHAVVVAHHVDFTMHEGEAVVDGQKVGDVPFVGEGGTDVILFGEGKRRRIFRGDRNARNRRAVQIDQAVGIRRLLDMPCIEREIERVIADVPGEFRADFEVPAGEIAKTLPAGQRRVDAVVQPVDRRWTRDIVAVGHGAKRSNLRAGPPMENRRRIVMNDVDRAPGRAAAEQRRTRPLQDFNAPHPVQRMHQTAELVAVGEAVSIDLGVQTADQEVVEITQRILSARVDAARIVDGVAQQRAALLGHDLARGSQPAHARR